MRSCNVTPWILLIYFLIPLTFEDPRNAERIGIGKSVTRSIEGDVSSNINRAVYTCTQVQLHELSRRLIFLTASNVKPKTASHSLHGAWHSHDKSCSNVNWVNDCVQHFSFIVNVALIKPSSTTKAHNCAAQPNEYKWLNVTKWLNNLNDDNLGFFLPKMCDAYEIFQFHTKLRLVSLSLLFNLFTATNASPSKKYVQFEYITVVDLWTENNAYVPSSKYISIELV